MRKVADRSAVTNNEGDNHCNRVLAQPAALGSIDNNEKRRKKNQALERALANGNALV
jgi:hypothetical protein